VKTIIYELSPAGTAEGCPGLRRGVFSAVPTGLDLVTVFSHADTNAQFFVMPLRPDLGRAWPSRIRAIAGKARALLGRGEAGFDSM
jgi:hypothetical protein